MRSYLRWHDLPVIVVSAHATPGQLTRMRDMGVIHIFEKSSYQLADLAAAIEDVLRK